MFERIEFLPLQPVKLNYVFLPHFIYSAIEIKFEKRNRLKKPINVHSIVSVDEISADSDLFINQPLIQTTRRLKETMTF